MKPQLIILTLVLGLLSFCKVTAQDYSIESNLLLAPPYPSNLDAYIDYLEEGIIEVTNLNNEAQEVFFSVVFEETSGLISVSTNGILGESIIMQPGVNIFTPTDIETVFGGLTQENLIIGGLSQAEQNAILLNRQMPEGNYRICISAFDEFGTALSDPSQGCFDFDIFFAERPIINSPIGGEEMDTMGFVFVTWDHIINSPQIASRLEYTLKLIDITEEAITNIELAMLDPAVPTIYEEELGNTFSANLLSDVDVVLETGHQYAVRVTASDPDESLGFQYGGHSEIVLFNYGEMEIEEEEEEEEENGIEVLAAPILITPENGFLSMPEDPLAIPVEWSHKVEDDALKPLLDYTIKIIDMDSVQITSISLDDFINDEYDYIFNKKLNVDAESDTSMQVLMSSVNTKLTREHKYAVVMYVESEDDRIEWDNDGYSELITFIIGEEEEVADAEEACGGDCLATLPDDKVAFKIKKNDNLFMGNVMLTVDKIDKDGDGEGTIFVNLAGATINILVDFEGIQANKQKFVFEGSATAQFDENFAKADGIVALGASSILDVDFEAAAALTTSLRNSDRLVSALKGDDMKLPLGLDRNVGENDKMIVGITQMDFTPTKATLTALLSIENPEWGDYIPTLAASNICFTRDGFGEVVKLSLMEDYNIPLSNEQLILKASENSQADEKGTYCIVNCDGFKEGQLTGEIGIPREMLLPEDDDGTILDDGFVKLTLSGTFTKGSGFLLSASMTPAQIPGLEGFSLVMEEGHYDASDEANPGGIQFPQGYSRDETDELWRGVWFNEVRLKAPADWGFADEADRTSVGIKNLIKDKAGFSIVATAENLLGIDKGNIEGFAISIDELSLDIIRGEFKEVKLAGRMGLPILNEGDYLDYEGIVDRDEKEVGKENKNNNAGNDAAAEALSMSFTVQPSSDGYDLDWIKSHVDFEEDTQIIFENNSLRKGVEAIMSGSITINSSMDGINEARDAGLPDIDLPGLSFEGMEISRMTDKKAKDDKNSKAKSGAFVFKRPSFSFLGINISDVTDGLNQDEPAEEEEDEDNDGKDPRVNGFDLNLTAMDLVMGGEENAEGESELTDGSEVSLAIAGEVSLVRGKKGGKKKKNEGLAISGSGGFTINAKATIDGTNTKIDYVDFGMDSLSIDASVSVMGIKGKLGFYNEHETFGDGAVGNIELTLPILTVGIDGRFGSVDDYTYWYLFGNVQGGTPDKPVPLATFYNIISIYGFNGGAYYHMTNRGGDTAEERYVPDESTFLGLEAGLTMAVTKPNVLWGNVTLGAEFNKDAGLNKMTLRGDGYILKSDMKQREEGEDLEGIEAKLVAELNTKDIDDISLTADMEIFTNVAGGVVTGTGGGYKMVDANLDINKDNWSLFMGTPDKRASVRVGIPNIDVGLTAEAYLMIGNKELPTAKLPSKILNMLSGSFEGNPDEDSKFSGGTNSVSQTRRNNGGFAFGASLEYNLNPRASILYADLWAGFGFDLSILEYDNVICANNGGEAIGMDGWYSEGTVYAGISGDVGLDVDCWAYTGKISLASLSAVMALSGGLPNPTFAKGRARMSYSVLGGIIEGSTSFGIDLGEQCEQDIVNPFANIEFIAGISPSNNTSSVSPFVQPKISLNQRLGDYYFYTRTKEGARREHKFKVEIADMSLKEKYTGKNISITDEKLESLEYVLRRSNPLDTYTTHVLSVKLKCSKWTSNGWELVMDDDTGKPWEEVKEATFKTGALPSNITMDNVKITYPFINESNYLHGNNHFKTGLLKLHYGVDYLFKQKAKSTDEWIDKIKVKFYKGSSLVATTDFVDKEGSVIEFEMPSSIDRQSVYQIKIVRTFVKNPNFKNTTSNLSNITVSNSSEDYYTIKREGKTYSSYNSKPPPDKVLFNYYFATSKYGSIKDKVSQKENYKIFKDDDFTWFQIENGEGFSEAEFSQDVWQSSTKNKGKVSAKHIYDNAYYNYLLDTHLPRTRDIFEHIYWQGDSDYLWRLGYPYGNNTLLEQLAEGIGMAVEERDGGAFKMVRYGQNDAGYDNKKSKNFVKTKGGTSFRSLMTNNQHDPAYSMDGSNITANHNLTYSQRISGVKSGSSKKGVIVNALFLYHDYYDNADHEVYEAIHKYNNPWCFGLEYQKTRYNNWKSLHTNYGKTDPYSSHYKNTSFKIKVTYSNPENPGRSGKSSYSYAYYIYVK